MCAGSLHRAHLVGNLPFPTWVLPLHGKDKIMLFLSFFSSGAEIKCNFLNCFVCSSWLLYGCSAMADHQRLATLGEQTIKFSRPTDLEPRQASENGRQHGGKLQ